MAISFSLDGDETKKLNKILKEHGTCLNRYKGAIGGSLTYSFSPTTLGVVTKVSCSCGKEWDLTNYLDW